MSFREKIRLAPRTVALCAAAAAILASVLVRVVVAREKPLWYNGSDARSYYETAVNMVTKDGAYIGFYNNPGMNLFLSAVYGLFGPDYLYGRYALIALGLLLAFYVFRIAKSTINAQVAAAAFAVCLFDPFLTFYATTEFGEMPMFVLVTMFFAHGIEQAKNPARRHPVIMGMAAGASALFKSWLLALVPLYVASRLAGDGCKSWKTLLKEGAIMALACLALLSPWAAYNYQRTGHAVLTSTNGPLMFFYGNNVYANTPVYVSANTAKIMELIDAKTAADDFELNRRALKYAYEFTKLHPTFFLKKAWLFFSRLWAYPNPYAHQRQFEHYRLTMAYLWFKWALALLGFFCSLKALWRRHLGIYLFFALATTVYALSVYLGRYKDILLPFQIVYFAVGLALCAKLCENFLPLRWADKWFEESEPEKS